MADLLSLHVERLEAAGIPEARLKAELLVADLLGCSRLELLLADRALTEEERERLQRGVERVAAGEPLQYVVGATEFMGHRFRTDRRALIPRPETEVLVETVLGVRDLWALESPRIVDVGTGTGCIVLSLALARPSGRYTAVDVSADALELARHNARELEVGDGVRFVQGDLLEGFPPASFDAVVANPPYVPKGALAGLPADIREHEPRTAVDGGPDGLVVIARLVPQAFRTLAPRGLLALEIGDGQAGAVRELAENAGFGKVEVGKDLAGRDRVVTGRRT